MHRLASLSKKSCQSFKTSHKVGASRQMLWRRPAFQSNGSFRAFSQCSKSAHSKQKTVTTGWASRTSPTHSCVLSATKNALSISNSCLGRSRFGTRTLSQDKIYLHETSKSPRHTPEGLEVIPNYLSKRHQDRIITEFEQIGEQIASKHSPEHNRDIWNLYGQQLNNSDIPHIHELIKKIKNEFEFPLDAFQLNRYYSSEWSCPAHIDAKSVGKKIFMLGFSSSCVLELQHEQKKFPQADVLFEPGTLVVLSYDTSPKKLL